MSYNSYIIPDEKAAVLDSVDASYAEAWLQNIRTVLADRQPDFLIVQHMEPDHSGSIARFAAAYPAAQIVATAKAFTMMQGFFGEDYTHRCIVIKDGDTLPLGTHTLTFLAAPMVHWPEVMMTYDAHAKALFSADAFGRFGPPDSSENWADEARRYYFGIIGRYGTQVQQLLKKAAALDIRLICPLHGPTLKKHLSEHLHLYHLWSSYQSEDDNVTIAYTSVYGHTQQAVQEIKTLLEQLGATVHLHDLVRGDPSAALADAFRSSRLILATTTYNTGIFPPMQAFIHALTERNFRSRTVGLIENGTWAPMAIQTMRKLLSPCKDVTIAETSVRITSALNNDSRRQLQALAEEMCKQKSE